MQTGPLIANMILHALRANMGVRWLTVGSSGLAAQHDPMQLDIRCSIPVVGEGMMLSPSEVESYHANGQLTPGFKLDDAVIETITSKMDCIVRCSP